MRDAKCVDANKQRQCHILSLTNTKPRLAPHAGSWRWNGKQKPRSEGLIDLCWSKGTISRECTFATYVLKKNTVSNKEGTLRNDGRFFL